MSAEQVLRLLQADAQSGAAMAVTLGVTRAAIWKHIQTLRDAGLEIHGKAGGGYQLQTPISLIDTAQVRSLLNDASQKYLGDWQHSFTIDSTNAALRRDASKLPNGSVYSSEQQSTGRGSRGRHWASPLAANLYFSLLWKFEAGLNALPGLSLVIGMSLAKALRENGYADVAVKWPNDLLVNGEKLGGILIEADGEHAGACTAIIGVGLNVSMPIAATKNIDQAWTDLRAMSADQTAPDRNQILALCLNTLLPTLAQFAAQGFEPWLVQWSRYDALRGKRITLSESGKPNLDAIALGVDASGCLLAEVDGKARRFVSAEVSVRQK